MRVCLVSSSLHPVPLASYGAVEAQMMEHARGLARLGYDVHVLTVGEHDEIASNAADGITFHRLGIAYESSKNGGLGGLPRSQIRFGVRARRLCERLAPEIVHWHSRYPCFVGVVGRSRAGGRARFIYHAHNWKLAERMSYPLLSPRRAAAAVGSGIDRRIARHCDHVIAISEFIRTRVVETARIPATKVSVLTNVVDTTLFEPEPTPDDRAGILFVGRVAAEKGVHVLIEAMSTVVRSAPETVLTIVGPDSDGTERGSYMRRCKSIVERKGLGARVRFRGEVPNRELPDLVRRCRVLAVPSIWEEPCGVVVLEGLACGVPVVGSRAGGIPELIEEGRTGLLVPPGDSTALARGLLDALADEPLQESARSLGPKAVDRSHTWNAVAERLQTIYRDVLDAERRPESA